MEFCYRTFKVEVELRSGSGRLFHLILQVGDRTDLIRVTQQVGAELELLTTGPSNSICRRSTDDTLFFPGNLARSLLALYPGLLT